MKEQSKQMLQLKIKSLEDDLKMALNNLEETKNEFRLKELKYKEQQSQQELEKKQVQEELIEQKCINANLEFKLGEMQRKNIALERQIQLQNEEKSEIYCNQRINQQTIQNQQNWQVLELKQKNEQLQQINETKEKQLSNLSSERQKLKLQIEEQNIQIQNNLNKFNLELLRQKNEIDKEHQNFLESRDEITKLKQEINNINQSKMILNQEKNSLSEKLNEQTMENKNLKNQIRQRDDKLLYKKQKLKQKKEDTKYYIQQIQDLNNNKSQRINPSVERKLQDYQEERKQIHNNLKKEYERNLQKQMEEARQEMIKEQKLQAEIQLKQLKQDLQQGTQRISQAVKTHGTLDVCFLLDVTGSMEPYKVQTKNCIQTSLEMIKNSCHRDTYWGAICYQDFEELRKLGRYQEFKFTEQSNQLRMWLESIRCEGGGDEPEDIRSAINQMCSLNWPSRFKIAILICDSPCHGRKYTGGLGDNYPNEDIQDAIDLLIKQNIILVGLNFTQKTIIMYQEFQRIYAARGRQELFLYADLQRVKIEDIASQMANWIAQASTKATLTDKKGTKFQLRDQPAFQHGPTEALFNQNNFLNCLNFDKNINLKVVNVRFKVFKVEIKEDVFEQNIQQIFQIQYPQDYQITLEGQWDCIRTDKPFAQGAMKDAFLMKKSNIATNELYVVKAPKNKGPYQSILNAILECRSHLVCQKLMKKFQNDLESSLQQKNNPKRYPSVVYSDILILEEANNKYWIAERYFNGQFIKYNNNWSYIDESVTDLNKIAQSFSYYTFLKSKQNYIVVDVQGIGIYFTDPAIHTKIGGFEQTDMGEDGISMYLVGYKKISQTVSKEILQIMDLYVP